MSSGRRGSLAWGRTPGLGGARRLPTRPGGEPDLSQSTELTNTALNTNATEKGWMHYAEGFLDFFQVIKFRFLAFILVPGSARRHGLQSLH